VTSHLGRHTSPLLLRATAATAIRVISPGAITTKGHNSDLPISPTWLTESGANLHKYLLISSALRRWLPRIDKTNFWCFRGRHHLLFLCSQVKGRRASRLVPPHLLNLGEVMLKSFIQTSASYNNMERVVLTSQRTTFLLVGFISQ
jgi:hypothetical protein